MRNLLLVPVTRVKSLLKGKQHIRSQHSHAPLLSVKRKMILSDAKCKKLKQPDAPKVFKSLMLYPDEREESGMEVFKNRLRTDVQEHLTSQIQEKSAIKWYFVMNISLESLTDNQEMEDIQSYFRFQCVTEVIEDTISQHIEERFSKVNKSLEEFIQIGSGWKLR